MPRIEGVSPEHASEELRATYAGVEKAFGRMLDPISVTAHSPEILAAYLKFEGASRRAAALDKKLKELSNLKTATVVGCPFCIDLGSFDSVESGVSEEQVRTLHEYATSGAFSATERLVLDYAVAMTRTPLVLDDALFEALRAEFSDAQLVELTATIAWENYRSRFNHAFGIKSHGFAENGVCALPVRD